MNKFSRLLTVLFLSIIMFSCADKKEFIINQEKVIVEPYGWFDLNAKNDSIEYKINGGNVVLSIIFCETIIVPIWLTGDQLYEPVRKNN